MTPDDRLLFKATFYATDPATFIRQMTPTQRLEYSRLLDRKADQVKAAYTARVNALADRAETLYEARRQLGAACMDEVPTDVTPAGCVFELRGAAILAGMRGASVEARAEALKRLAA